MAGATLMQILSDAPVGAENLGAQVPRGWTPGVQVSTTTQRSSAAGVQHRRHQGQSSTTLDKPVTSCKGQPPIHRACVGNTPLRWKRARPPGPVPAAPHIGHQAVHVMNGSERSKADVATVLQHAQLAPDLEPCAKSMAGHQLPWQVGKVVRTSTA